MNTKEEVLRPEVIPSRYALGADISGIDLSKPLTENQLALIQEAWKQHLVLRFKNQGHVTVDQQIAFSRNFGPLDKRPTASHGMSKEHDALPPEIAVISNVKVGGIPVGALGDGEAVWHVLHAEGEHCLAVLAGESAGASLLINEGLHGGGARGGGGGGGA